MNKLKIMLVGLPGKMPSLVAERVAKSKDLELVPYGLSNKKDGMLDYCGTRVELIPQSRREELVSKELPDIIVDFSNGDLEENCRMYCDFGIPFVLGSTGGDRETMKKIVENSNVSAVIAPNMASTVVAIQAMLEYAARNFPDVFSGYSLEITESHQKMKTDTSGTALAFEELLNAMGAVSDRHGILSIRDPLTQERLCGISRFHLKGHGHHKYILVSSDNTVRIGLVHNVDGRNAYVDGTIEAIRFLAKRSGEPGKVFSMTDVLKG